MYAVFAEAAGLDYFTVAVEMEQTAIVGHHHAMKEIQTIGVQIENNLDTTKITIENPDGGDYIINF